MKNIFERILAILVFPFQLLQLTSAKTHPFSPRMLPESKIVGGITATAGEFPSIIYLRFRGCAGTVIDKEWALTAAHCAVYMKPDPTENRMSAGKHNADKNNEPNEQLVHATDIYIHEEFDGLTFRNDIALMKIAPPFQFNEFVQAALLPGVHDNPSGIQTVVGWGSQCPEETRAAPEMNDENCKDKPQNPELQKVDVPIVTNEQCEKAYPDKIFETNICAGYAEGGKDGCYGDSGGPLYQHGANNETILIGIVSWGKGCAQPNQPGVYTRVSKYICWIKRLRNGHDRSGSFWNRRTQG